MFFIVTMSSHQILGFLLQQFLPSPLITHTMSPIVALYQVCLPPSQLLFCQAVFEKCTSHPVTPCHQQLSGPSGCLDKVHTVVWPRRCLVFWSLSTPQTILCPFPLALCCSHTINQLSIKPQSSPPRCLPDFWVAKHFKIYNPQRFLLSFQSLCSLHHCVRGLWIVQLQSLASTGHGERV